MVNIPSHCHSCGAIFPSRIISISGSVKNLTLSNNSETCPNCGGRAYLADGIFNIADDVISIIKAPSFTKEMMGKLGAAVVEAYKDPTKTEDLLKVAESIDPKIAEAVQRLTSKNNLSLVGLFLLAMAIKSCSIDISLDVNELIDQINNEPPQSVDIETFRV